jgi:hypothetical protein
VVTTHPAEQDYASAIKLSADAAIAPTAAKGETVLVVIGAMFMLTMTMMMMMMMMMMFIVFTAATAFYASFLVEVSRVAAKRRPKSVAAVTFA